MERIQWGSEERRLRLSSGLQIHVHVCFWMATSICVHTERASNHCQFLDNPIDRWSKMATIFIAVFCFGHSVGGKIKNRQEIWEAQHYFPSWQEEFLASFEKSRVQARHSHHRGKRQPPTYQLNPIFDPTVPEWWSPLPLRLHTLPLWPHTLPRWASHLTPRLHTLPLGLPTLPVSLCPVCSPATSHPRACCWELCEVDQPQEGLTSGFSKPRSETSWRAWTLFQNLPCPFLSSFSINGTKVTNAHTYIWNTQKCIFVYSPFLFFSWLYFFLCTCAQQFFFQRRYWLPLCSWGIFR